MVRGSRFAVRGWLIAVLAWGLGAEEGVFKPNIRYSTYSGQGIEIHVPATLAAQLKPLAERAVGIYARMQADAGWTPTRTLHLVLSDDEDTHNGFSTVVPFPLVNVQLGPTRPESGLFSGDDESVRTIVHELGHHLSNDRNHGWRGGLESVFGRVLPSEPLSLAVFLFSTPNHVLSPAFWHEGLAQWAETAYADPTSAWGGRGRDSLNHMVWRLDAAQGAIPESSDWRLSYETWPYGNRAYLYGLAYTRWLSGAFGDRRGLWRLVDDQGRLSTPFAFTGGSETSIGFTHQQLIARARLDLLDEQRQAIVALQVQPVTRLERLTPPDWRVSAPAWSDTQHLIHAGDPPQGHPGIYSTLAGISKLPANQDVGISAWQMGIPRRILDGVVVQADADVAGDQWQRSRVRIIARGRVIRTWDAERMVQPDARMVGDSYQMTATPPNDAPALGAWAPMAPRSCSATTRSCRPAVGRGHPPSAPDTTSCAGSRPIMTVPAWSWPDATAARGRCYGRCAAASSIRCGMPTANASSAPATSPGSPTPGACRSMARPGRSPTPWAASWRRCRRRMVRGWRWSTMTSTVRSSPSWPWIRRPGRHRSPSSPCHGRRRSAARRSDRRRWVRTGPIPSL